MDTTCYSRFWVALTVALFAGCGGEVPDRVSAPQTTVVGAVVKGPVGGATVCAYELAATGKGHPLGCTSTDTTGAYTLRLDYTGPVLLEASGGTYTDEATGVVGVALDAPLTVASRLDAGTNTVVATPLTTIATQRALGTGNLSLASFDSSLAEVKRAFGLPRGLDLVRSIPNVQAGSSDAYGNALVGVSKMLVSGASLSGLVTSTDMAALATSYRICNRELLEVAVDLGVNLGPDVPLDGAATIIDVIAPNAAWRAALPVLNAATSCTVTLNTEANVRLSCTPETALGGFGVFAGDADQFPAFNLTPTVALLIVHGDRIVLSGGPLRLTSTAAIYIDGGIGTVTMPQSVVTAGTITVTGLQNTTSECRLRTTGAYAVLTGPDVATSTGGGLIVSNGGGGSNLSLGGGSSNTLVAGGQITVVSGAGGISVNGSTSLTAGGTGGISVNGAISPAGSAPPGGTVLIGP